MGGELSHALQDEPVQPLIPLGSTGQLQGVQWQVVGYQHRLGTEDEDPDEILYALVDDQGKFTEAGVSKF